VPTHAGSKPSRIDPRSFEAILAAFVRELRAQWYSKAMVKQARTIFGRFFAHLRARRIRDVRAVSEGEVFAYVRALAAAINPTTGERYALSTQGTHIYLLQRLFRFLERRGVVLRDPTLNLVRPSWRRLPRAVINQAQSRRLVAKPDPSTPRGKRDRAILELLYGTAVRVGECERLDLADVDLGKGLVMIRSGKGKKDRIVPIVGRAAAAVDLYLREARSLLLKDPRERALFLNRRGARVNVKRIQDLVRTNAKAAGLEIRVTPHTLRHGCATHLLQGGADVRHVQQLLGHANVQTTALYTHVVPGELAKVVTKAHPRERLWRSRGSAPERPRRKRR
jgi:integrase/recombinase XerD